MRALGPLSCLPACSPGIEDSPGVSPPGQSENPPHNKHTKMALLVEISSILPGGHAEITAQILPTLHPNPRKSRSNPKKGALHYPQMGLSRRIRGEANKTTSPQPLAAS